MQKKSGFIVAIVVALSCLSPLATPSMLHGQTPTSDTNLARWRQNASKASSKPVNVIVIGDSIACCVGPANYENVWTNILRQQMTQRFGDHGSGIIPVGKDSGLAVNPQWSLHPAGGTITTVSYGPYQAGTGAFGGVFRLQGNAHLTVLLPVKHPDAITLYYATTTDSGTGIAAAFDDAPAKTFGSQASAAFEAHSVSIPMGKAPASTLTFSAAAPEGSAYIYAVEFLYGSKGISVHNLAHGYARTEAWGGDPAAQLAFLSQIRGGIGLAIVTLGVNDAINHMGTTADEYRTHMIAIVQHLRALDPAVPIVLYDEISTSGEDNGAPLPQHLVREQEQQLAKEFGLGYLSPLASFGTAAEAGERGFLGHDNVHPTDLGDRKIADILDRYLRTSTLDLVP